MAKEMATTKQVVTTTGGSDTDSNNTNNQQNPMMDSKNSSPKFKGLVPQQNGHWGAQLYVDHDRKWLGTFKSEKEAAMAYDSAALKIRGGDCHRNFPCDEVTVQERKFQDLLSREDVLNMIRDGTYQNKFTEFMRNQSQKVEKKVEINLGKERIAADGGFLYRQLFQKVLTRSDVGNLNRLVIPKRNAVKFFPQVSNGSPKKDGKEEGGIVDMQLVFFDRQMKSWTFRYCYWNSSQSFVFTKGWIKFVKEKDLKIKDIVTFYRCEPRNKDGLREQQQVFCLIDVVYNASENENENENNNDIVEELDQYPPQENVDLQLGLSYSSLDADLRQEEEPAAKRPKLTLPLLEPKKGIWLLGVRIG